MTSDSSRRLCLALVGALCLPAAPLRGDPALVQDNHQDNRGASTTDGPELSSKRLELRGVQDTLNTSDEQRRKIES